MPRNFPFYRQLDQMDCGPACLRMVAAWHGREYSLQYLRERSYIDREGVSLRGITEAAEQIGLRTLAVKLPFRSESDAEAGLNEAPLPCIAHWRQNHFVVVYRIGRRHVWIADPAVGKRKLSVGEFLQGWLGEKKNGIALLLEPTPEFYSAEEEKIDRFGLGFLFRYLPPYRKLIIQLFLGLILGSLFQLTFPFLTQAIVDIGIQNQDIHFIYLILLAQLMLFLGQLSVNVIQNWILLHIGARVNVALISDFLIKLMKLPIGFFDSKMTGDLLQRILDHRRVELFLTNSTLGVVFGMFNLLVFGVVLLIYNSTIFFVFTVSAILYVLWILLFLRRRAEVDHRRFRELSDNQSALIELIQGMQEIKLQRSERKRRRHWANIQARLFRANVRSLAITQYQDAGAGFVSQLKDILIIFIAAKAVVDGSMTLGMMLAVQFIVGQLNGPLQQFINFIRTAQDARISLERLGEIHSLEVEEPGGAGQADLLPREGNIQIEGLSFQYNKLAPFALQDIDLVIPWGKVTAIVGASGSGKTTLVKLLLGFYRPTEGKIRVGGIHMNNISAGLWREQCGAVMQDGFIFSDTIARNIAESEDGIDQEKLLKAVHAANIQEFVESLPLGYNTMIGPRGNGLSQGQRQRLLIARAVYKNPAYLFFDEATNALDSLSEKVIMDHMQAFFSGRTVVVVAHRLSTVRNADQIIVLDQGKIVERGTHDELVGRKGAYFTLVKNQLELGA
jgi:ATP-binding cassette, subfamily B, bacterial